ncbi:flavodoxin family protein [Desulfurococcaceae archaeon MEX13E-LK6-19]|nr:flavodoxin family protein [Desulfurococcaceae archaeon MEX13E-LK6-19]
MKIALVYYSRTRNTEHVARVLTETLSSRGVLVDLYVVRPLREYGRPLHLNPRLLYDTLVRKGTSIKIEPCEFRAEKYDVVVVASPIWCDTLAAPVQEFLRRHITVEKPLVVVTTSLLQTSYSRIERVVEKITGRKPVFHINIPVAMVKDENKLKQVVQEITERITRIHVSRGTIRRDV